MLSRPARSRLTVVLVGARNPQNIGAVARAMQDFGFHDLRVVNDFGAPFEAAQLEAKSAVGAGEVMRTAQRFSSLSEAIADCTLVVGTTAIGGRELRLPVLPLRQAAPQILAHLSLQPAVPEPITSEPPAVEPVLSTQELHGIAPPDVPGSHVALLFGSEKTGLTNQQLSYCSLLLTIPLFAPEGRHLSMNLGQAAAVCLYELSRDGFEGSRDLPSLQQMGASTADRERLTSLLLQTMETSDYGRRFPANARPEVVRQLAADLGLTREKAATWMGLFKMVLHSLTLAQNSTGHPPKE
ncbi:MAG: RNA methyltransferase [Janthinobacterium lividum]